MFLIGMIGIIFFTNIFSGFYRESNNNIKKDLEYKDPINLKDHGYWDLTGTPIYIDDSDPNYNWNKTVADNDWCTGAGTMDEPYIIENVTINGLNSGSCIVINNSDAYFTIRYCSIFNSSPGSYPNYQAGIKLENVKNGILINNNISNNYGYGIYLVSSNNTYVSTNIISNNWYNIYLSYSNNNTVSNNILTDSTNNCIYLQYSDNNTISMNIISDNTSTGIHLMSSDNNMLLKNSISKNGVRGIWLRMGSDNNMLSKNILLDNIDYGIFIENSNENNLLMNTVSNNTATLGIYIYYSDYTNLSMNTISNYWYGIYLQNSNNNTLAINKLLNNTANGINLQESDSNIITENQLENNNNAGIFIDDLGSGSDDNLFFKNYMINNSNHAIDEPSTNYWNNTRIGNYWDNYVGSDANNDGIGDTNHSLTGGIDYLPIYGNPYFDGNPIHIDDSGVSGHTWEWTSTRAWCDGTGTWSDPYVIEDLIIDGKNSGNCILIENSNEFFRIENCTLFNSSSLLYTGGIKLNNVKNGKIYSDNCSYNNQNGIILSYSNNNSILGNIASDNGWSGIWMKEGCENNTISTNFVYNNLFGIDSDECDNNTISENTIYDNGFGISLTNNDISRIINNNIIENVNGIEFSHENNKGCHNNIIKGNNISNNDIYGILIYDYSSNNTILDNIINNNINGIILFKTINNTIIANIINNNDEYGIKLSSSNYTLVFGNILNDNVLNSYFEDNSLNNIFLWNVYDYLISPFIIDDGGGGDFNWTQASNKLAWCSGSGTVKDPYIITDLIINGSNIESCITIKNSDVYFIIENCIISNARDHTDYAGILMNNVHNATLFNNSYIDNGYSGIKLIDSTNNTIKRNEIYDAGSAGINLYQSNNNNVSLNNLDNCHNAIIEYGSNDNIISENTIDNSWIGVYLSAGNQNNVTDNKIYNNDYSGIYFYSDSNIISRNLLYYNDQGIFSQHSNFNTVSDNIIYNSTNEGIYFMFCDDGVISGNNLSYNNIGIWLSDHCDNNNFSGNDIHDNNNYGIYIEDAFTDSNNNLFYNNSFFKNGINAFDGGTGTNNKWNKTNMGNFWDDYSGVDNDDDGIGDTPYNISGVAGGQDHFPIWYDGHNGSKIVIDDDSWNNWTWAETREWCSGSGTFNDPYIIKDCVIDGNNLDSCITIKNSDVYFVIEDCITFNCSSGQAGIKLINVLNGQLLNNNCSNNIGHGIYLSNSHNNTILGNIANYNDEFGIFLEASNNNTLSENTLNENFYGMYLGLSINNTISENSAYNNDWQGIYLSSSSNKNTILNNNATYNNDNGILVDSSNYNKLIGNNMSYNTFAGLYLYRSNNTDVIQNNFIGNLHNVYEIECENNKFILNFYDGILSLFVVDDNGGGDLTWAEAAVLFIWCTGSGSYSDPYIIQNLIIDGQNSSSCIEIRDSNVYFIIQNSTFYNSGSGLYNAGIELTNVINGQLINNNCSNNNGVGIGLYQSHNITIDGNIVNNNKESGIFLEVSHNNILSGNTLNENSNGVYLGLSTNNTISENSAFNNDLRGIYVSSLSNNNTIMSNNVTYNGDNGIDIYDSHDIRVVGNIADHNGWNGIFVWECNNTTVVRNIANYNTNAGLYLWSSNNTAVIGNVFIGNLYSIYESGGENNFIMWNFENGYTDPIIIDDSGTGDFTWIESINQLAWIYGSGTLSDPYIIELITIDGLNLTSCLTIRNSIAYFKIQNCTFYNSGDDLYDGGIKLVSASNGELIYNNCSFNNANGIILDSCQNILITENSINHNERSGIILIDSSNIDIINNKETINFNELYGIHLSNSHYNNITSNTINNNLIGIFLDQSNYNYIDWNTLLDNDQAIVDNGVGNIIGFNNNLPSEANEFPFDILIIVLIIGLVVVGVTGAAIIIKKRISIPAKKEKEISEKKKEKIRAKLEGKLEFVDYLIKEGKIKLAYKNLGKIQDTADMYDFYYIFNKANEKVERCKEIEAEISKPVIKEEVTPPVKEREVKKVIAPLPIIKKEEEKKYNLFISYSTVDRDYFQIEKIVKELKKYPNINLVSYWERDSKANIVEFMDETLELSSTFILFCSEHSVKSKAVKDEWQAAFQMRKEGLIKLIPVYEEQKHIPKILWHLLNVKYEKDNFKGFIENLYTEIMRE